MVNVSYAWGLMHVLTNKHRQLFGQLNHRRNSRCSTPVEVVVAEPESYPLNDVRTVRMEVIFDHVVVSWGHRALTNGLTDKEEVVPGTENCH